jgi:hypothetical protein
MPRAHIRRRFRTEVIWLSRGWRTFDPQRGLRLSWHDSRSIYEIVQFAGGMFEIYFERRQIASRRSLARAKRFCARHLLDVVRAPGPPTASSPRRCHYPK